MSNDKKIIEYVVVAGYVGFTEFQDEVNHYLKNGYSLYGHPLIGVVKYNGCTGHDLYQAVVKYED